MRIDLILLITAITLSCSNSSDQRTSTNTEPSYNDFLGKSYDVAIDGPNSDSFKDVQIMVLFEKDTTGVFRMKKGAMLTQRPFIWQIAKDSIYFKYFNTDVEVTKARIDTYTEPYHITQQQAGYLLKGKRERILLSALK